MRPESEIRAFIADLEFALSLPGSIEPQEGIMRTHVLLLRWALGEENEATKARNKLREAINENGAHGRGEREAELF